MKKKIAIALAIAATLIKSGMLYPDTMIVTETDYKNDLVTISTAEGFTYQFYGVEDYFVGDLVSCIMYSKGTEKITDDVIMSHRYSGVTEFFDEIATPEKE